MREWPWTEPPSQKHRPKAMPAVIIAIAIFAVALGFIGYGGYKARTATTPRRQANGALMAALGALLVVMFLFSTIGTRTAVSVGFIAALAIVGVATLFWIDTLLECLELPPRQDDERIVWVLVILLTFVIGAFLFKVMGRQRLTR